MKCENCGKNEVTFIYQSNVNGQVTEKHLCSECAEKLGLTRQVAARSQRMMRNFFGDSFFGGGFLADFFADMPALSAAPAQQEAQKQEKQDDLVGKEEQSRFSYLRQMNALRMEMKKAVHEENFERAAQLRDQIHQLEQQHKEQKESK